MLQRCACDEYDIEANYATYVRNFKPLCHEETCRKVKERRAAGQSRVLLFDEKEKASEPVA